MDKTAQPLRAQCSYREGVIEKVRVFCWDLVRSVGVLGCHVQEHGLRDVVCVDDGNDPVVVQECAIGAVAGEGRLICVPEVGPRAAKACTTDLVCVVVFAAR